MKILYKLTICSLILMFFTVNCKKDDPEDEGSNINITTPSSEKAYVYVDGEYTGKMTTDEISISKGEHIIGVALQDSWVYLRKEVVIADQTKIEFTLDDKPQAKTWKALWVGLHKTSGDTDKGLEVTNFTLEDLDAGYNFFTSSIKNHFEKFSYNTTKWQITRKNISTPVKLTKESSTHYVMKADAIIEKLPEIKPGAYDCVFVFWREQEGSVSFRSPYYLGLAWTNPLGTNFKTGYVTIKLDIGEGTIADRIAHYQANDPGIWVHEWLHTTAEIFYINRGRKMPEPAGGLVLHAAENYNYKYPWLQWYEDIMTGRVKSNQNSSFLGIGPEAFLKCTVREVADNSCKDD